MTCHVALLRAVNVGGTGKLSMADLKIMCAAAGFKRVETYIASGNVVFDSDDTAAQVQSELAAGLLAYAGKPVEVFVRTAAEMQAIVSGTPFPDKQSKLKIPAARQSTARNMNTVASLVAMSQRSKAT